MNAAGNVAVGRAHRGLTKWKNKTTIFRKANGLPDDAANSLFEDYRGRIWALRVRRLAYFTDSRLIAVNGVPSEKVYSITGDKAAA